MHPCRFEFHSLLPRTSHRFQNSSNVYPSRPQISAQSLQLQWQKSCVPYPWWYNWARKIRDTPNKQIGWEPFHYTPDPGTTKPYSITQDMKGYNSKLFQMHKLRKTNLWRDGSDAFYELNKSEEAPPGSSLGLNSGNTYSDIYSNNLSWLSLSLCRKQAHSSHIAGATICIYDKYFATQNKLSWAWHKTYLLHM